MKALFFAEGGPGIGLGHLRRCTALAHGMGLKGWDCRFLAHEAAARSWLGEQGHALAPCEPPAGGHLPEADYACDVFVLDSYKASNDEVAAKAKGKARLILAFDDHMNRHPVADIVMSSGALAPYDSWPGQVDRLLGPRYHPLPPEYLPVPLERDIRPGVARVLVTLGGAGDAAVFERIVAAVGLALPEAAVDYVLGPFAGDPGLENRAGVTLIRSPRSLKPFMLACDLAVAASGQTLLELVALGTPSVALALAPSQVANLTGMDRARAALSAGVITDAGFDRTLVERIRRACDPGVRARLSEAGRALVDGRGADRIEAALARSLKRGAVR